MAQELECDLLILGASFTGIELIHQLLRRNKKLPGRTVVVDRQDCHAYIPLCHELLCNRLRPDGASLPTARLLENVENCQFVRGNIQRFDPSLHELSMNDGIKIRGKICVFALGSELRAPEFGHDGIPMFAHKFGSQWSFAREQLGGCLNRPHASRRILVVGGGISGVELAGELAYMIQKDEAGEDVAITLLHPESRLLSGLCRRAGIKAQIALEELGVDVRLNSRLNRLHAWGAQFQTRLINSGNGGTTHELIELACDLGFWAGGIRPPAILGDLKLIQTGDKWLEVSPTLQCRRRDGIVDHALFAGGDNARIVSGTGQWPTMKRAIECIWQAKNLAENISNAFANFPSFTKYGSGLKPHTLRRDFPHGVSIGDHSLVVYGPLVWDGRSKAVAFRRFLMRKYMERYQGSMGSRLVLPRETD